MQPKVTVRKRRLRRLELNLRTFKICTLREKISIRLRKRHTSTLKHIHLKLGKIRETLFPSAQPVRKPRRNRIYLTNLPHFERLYKANRLRADEVVKRTDMKKVQEWSGAATSTSAFSPDKPIKLMMRKCYKGSSAAPAPFTSAHFRFSSSQNDSFGSRVLRYPSIVVFASLRPHNMECYRELAVEECT